MAKFPIKSARQELGFSPSTAVRANIDVRGTGGNGAAVGQAIVGGVKLIQRESARKEAIRVKNRENLDSLSAEQAKQLRKIRDTKIEEMKGNTAPEKWEENTAAITTEYNTKVGELDLSPMEAARQQIISAGDMETIPNLALIEASGVISDATVETAKETLTDAYRNQVDDIAKKELDFAAIMKRNGRPAGEILLSRKAAKAAGGKGAIEDIKPTLIVAIEENGNKDDGYAALDEALGQLFESGLITKAEGAEASKALGDWMDNYVSGRIKAEKDAEKLTVHQTYKDFGSRILAPENKLTWDEIVTSKALDTDQKAAWTGYLKASYEDAPTKSDPEAYEETLGIVLNGNQGILSPEEAYDELMQWRFGEKGKRITNDDFNWAVDKLNNPYPPELITDIRIAIKNNFDLVWYLRKGVSDESVNRSLTKWIDNLIAEDKVPKFDFGKKLNAMSEYYRWGQTTFYEIGMEIERGGRTWEVVDIDSNGEPSVDEVH